jgi:hypothetical protein
MADLRGAFFVEAEWNGEGSLPDVQLISRGAPLNEKQRKALETHYGALAKLLANPADHAERMLLDGGIFAADEYADIRWRVLNLENLPAAIASRIVKESTIYADNQKAVKSFNPSIVKLEGNLAIADGYKVAAKKLESVCGYVYVRENATFSATNLNKCGYVDVREKATFTAPALAEVSGSFDVRENATFTAPALVKSGYVDVRENATFTAPTLEK